jgi:hypothetical protein
MKEIAGTAIQPAGGCLQNGCARRLSVSEKRLMEVTER